MIALPSIAFGGFSGSAKGVTARYQDGRSILSLKCYPTGEATILQLARRTSLKKITKTWPLLTDQQRLDWERLAEHASGISVFGQKAKLSGINLFVRLNSNRQMAGEEILTNAPNSTAATPNVEYSNLYVTPDLVTITGIRHQPSPYKLVVKMSASQSPGITNGWSKTVIISGDTEDDWGETDVTELYLNKIGVAATPGQKVFVETYWLDTETGFTGQAQRDSVVCTGEAAYTPRTRVTMRNLKQDEEQQVSALDVDFSTGAPVVQFDSVCLGHGNVASSYAYLDQELPEECQGTSMALGRGMAEGNAGLAAQSYIIWLHNNSWDPAYICFAHRGGYYVKPTEVFGPGILY